MRQRNRGFKYRNWDVINDAIDAVYSIGKSKKLQWKNTNSYRENNVTDVIDYTISGNTLYATFNANKNYQKQLAQYCDESYHQNEDGTCDESWFDYMYEPLMKSLTI